MNNRDSHDSSKNHKTSSQTDPNNFPNSNSDKQSSTLSSVKQNIQALKQFILNNQDKGYSLSYILKNYILHDNSHEHSTSILPDASEIMKLIDENSSLYSINDDLTKAIIITFSEAEFIKLYNYATEKGFIVIKYFGLPQKETVYHLLHSIVRLTRNQDLQEQKLIIALDNLDSLSCIYSRLPELDAFITREIVEIHLPLEDIIIKHGELNPKTIQWYLLSNLARFLSLKPPTIALHPETEGLTYMLAEKFIVRNLKITSQQQDDFLKIIRKAISYTTEENEDKAWICYTWFKELHDEILQNLQAFIQNDCSKEEYYDRKLYLERSLPLAMGMLQDDKKTLSTFGDAILCMIDIVENGNHVFKNTASKKKQLIINLIFTKLELVYGKLEYTVHPAFSFLVKK